MDIVLAGSALARKWSDAELQGISIQLSAFDGEIGNSTIPVPDPTGADEVPPGRAVRVSEGTTRLLDGIIVDEGRSRGFEPTNPNKKDDYTVQDPNTFLFGFRVIASRPEESDYTRIQWFFDTYLPAADTTWILNTFTTTMVAAKYQSDGVADVMRDAIDITGKTLFVHDKAAGGLCAHWHGLTAGHPCGLTIDDTDPTVNGPTSWLPQNPSRVKDGHDLTNDYAAYGADGIGPVTVSDPTSIATYDVDGKSHQAFANFPEATDIATLTADANRILETNKDARDTWTCTIGPLDATALALIRVGDIIPCTSTVMTLTASPQRIASLRLTLAGGQRVAPTLWMAELTLGAPVRGPGARPSGMVRPPVAQMPGTWSPFVTDPDKNFWGFRGSWDPRIGAEPGFVADPGADCGAHVYDSADHMESFTTAGAVLVEPGCQGLGDVFRVGSRSQPSDPGYSGYKNQVTDRIFLTLGPSGYSGMLHLNLWKITDSAAAPTTANLRYRPYGYTGTPASGIDLSAPSITYPIEFSGPVFTTGTYRYWSAAFALPLVNVRQLVLDSLDYWYTDGPFFVGINAAAMAAANAAPPGGHPTTLISAGPADGVTTSYTGVSPYRPNSLEVLVGGLPWTADGYVETDPATGAFDFTQVPDAGSTAEENLIEYRYVTV